MTTDGELLAIEKRVLARQVAEGAQRELDRLFLEEVWRARAQFAVQLRPLIAERDRALREAADALQLAVNALPSGNPYAGLGEDPEEEPTRRQYARVSARARAEAAYRQATEGALARFAAATAELRLECDATESKIGSRFAQLGARARERAS